jgi:hypothetical protein
MINLDFGPEPEQVRQLTETLSPVVIPAKAGT